MTASNLDFLVKTSINNGDKIPDDWKMNDSDVTLLESIFTQKKPANDSDKAQLISDFTRIDSKTHRLMIAGFMIYDGVAYFADEADAVAFLNANGTKCDSFDEAYNLSEEGVIDDTFYTDWYEPFYS